MGSERDRQLRRAELMGSLQPQLEIYEAADDARPLADHVAALIDAAVEARDREWTDAVTSGKTPLLTPNQLRGIMEDREHAAVEAERERCAKLIQRVWEQHVGELTADVVAAAIREADDGPQ